MEEIVLNYLLNRLDVPICTERPEEKTAKYIIVEKIGSSNSNTIVSSTIAVKSYASTLYGAAELNEDMKEVMAELVLLDEIIKCELNTDYNFTDPDTKEYLYQAIFNINHY